MQSCGSLAIENEERTEEVDGCGDKVNEVVGSGGNADEVRCLLNFISAVGLFKE